MTRSVLLALALAPIGANAGLESALNPMMLANPLANPLAMAVPLGSSLLTPSLFGSPYGGGIGSPFGGGFGSPLGGYGSPFGGLGSPLGLTGLGGASVLRPALQVAPSLLSFQHQVPQMLTNPYMGGPYGQLPFAQANQPGVFGSNPFGAGAQAYPYGFSPYAGQGQAAFGAAFPGTWGTVARPAPVPQPAANPYLPQFGGQAQATAPQAPNAQQVANAQALASNLSDLLRSLAVAPPLASSGPAQTGVPFTSPWGADAAPAPGPAPAAPDASGANPWGTAPALQADIGQVGTAPAVVANPPSGDAALTPFDPAYWLLPTPEAAK
ncbi:MAG: hypothetical protein IPG66_15680 [Hydrogenophilales bacterium]|nr:hypothetical protein [Hydrogenophilales bacterium]